MRQNREEIINALYKSVIKRWGLPDKYFEDLI